MIVAEVALAAIVVGFAVSSPPSPRCCGVTGTGADKLPMAILAIAAFVCGALFGGAVSILRHATRRPAQSAACGNVATRLRAFGCVSPLRARLLVSCVRRHCPTRSPFSAVIKYNHGFRAVIGKCEDNGLWKVSGCDEFSESPNGSQAQLPRRASPRWQHL